MDEQEVNIFEKNRRSKYFSLIFIIGLLVFLIIVELNIQNPKIFNLSGFWIVNLMILIFKDLIVMRAKIIISPKKIMINNGFWRRTIAIDAICVVKMEKKALIPPCLVIQTDQSIYRVGQELKEMQIKEVVVCIFEQIRLHYPDNLAKICKDLKQKEQEAVTEFWKK